MAVSSRAVALPERVSFARIPDIRPMPGLIQIQLDSFEWFKKEGLRELFEEISPIEDFTGKNLSLEFIVPPEPFGKPKYNEDECRDRDATYSAPLNVKARLINKETGEIIEKDIFMGDFPLMTKEGTFIINGAERVVVSQLVRSPACTSPSMRMPPLAASSLPPSSSLVEVHGWNLRPATKTY